MAGETNLQKLISEMKPVLNAGEYVFCSVQDMLDIDRQEIIGEFQEAEGRTLILAKAKANELGLTYDYIASWITLNVHSALEAVGLTAAFSDALAENGISCNVVAGYYHDHIFVDRKDGRKAMEVLKEMSAKAKG